MTPYNTVGCNGSEYTKEQLDFIFAIDNYIRKTKNKFPTYSDIFKIAFFLGYRREQSDTVNTVKS